MAQKVLKRQKIQIFIDAKIRCLKKNINIWNKTPFEGLRIDKKQILRVLELWIAKASKNIISFVTGIDRKTVWRILKRTKDILIPNYYTSLDQIGGKDMIVEIDESKFGKRKYNRGHHVEGVWVLGLIERQEPKRIRLYVLDDRKKDTLNNLITKNVEQTTTIITDGWKGYVNLKNLFSEHQVVNHSLHYKDPATNACTNTIEGSWLGVKMHIPPRGRTKDG